MRESVPSGVRSPWLGAGFVGASVAWAALLPLAPFLASRAHASGFDTTLVVVVYSVGSLICHQLPERSYHLWTAQMPVCARCMGIYVGAAVAAVVAYVSTALTRCPTPRSNLTPLNRPVVAHRLRGAISTRVVLFAAAVPTILTLLYEWTTGVTPSNSVRAAAGLPIGAAVAWLVVVATRAGAAAENQVN